MRSRGPWRFPNPDTGGSILVVTLWLLFLLGVLAVAAGTLASRRVEAADRLRGRVLAYAAARAGVVRAVAVLGLETNGWDALSERWASSRDDFAAVRCGNGQYSVVRLTVAGQETNVAYGASDEEGRIDVNRAAALGLRGLLTVAGGLQEGEAEKLATNLVASRTGADSMGHAVDTPFLCVEDVATVPGFTPELLRRVRPFLTVHGGRRVNINTSDPVVLESLMSQAVPAGVSREAMGRLTRKVLQFREGGGIFTTHVGPGMAEVLGRVVALDADERSLLYALSPWVTVASQHFRIVSEGGSDAQGRYSRRIECVWNRETRTFESWHED